MLHEELYLFPFHDYSLIYPSNRGEIDKKNMDFKNTISCAFASWIFDRRFI